MSEIERLIRQIAHKRYVIGIDILYAKENRKPTRWRASVSPKDKEHSFLVRYGASPEEALQKALKDV